LKVKIVARHKRSATVGWYVIDVNRRVFRYATKIDAETTARSLQALLDELGHDVEMEWDGPWGQPKADEGGSTHTAV
jgi:hypothetical protein